MKRNNTKKKNDIVFILFSLVLGLLMGWLTKDFGGSGTVGAILKNLGIWIFAGSILAVYSQSAVSAALHTFALYTGALASYIVHGMLIGNNTMSIENITFHLVCCVLGAIMGFIIWHANDREWVGAACASVPISLLIAEGYPVYHSTSIALWFDMCSAIILYIILPDGKNKRLMALPFIIVFVFALVYFDVLSKYLGGFI